ncbi:hypothetical protein EPUS_02594 [Endocarpon pusillum Z07020]|uniref:DUF676 domain-containing protein n=1 Tax=Endocarpon pusillum (strain Z07020 / HMAS-L-300199) TaxID=1263415 RepID=U1GWL2_ENDPU|nr:uncharacterized protein EPUS_02594 [Endocarpon pusillum Z07020]ERF76883.1 hypothetical protein EPUS_02594 [Endocarpon pusillum Z07020]
MTIWVHDSAASILPFSLASISRQAVFYNMEEETRRNFSDASRKADHLCVLVHGLWGNPSHLNYVASALREKYGEDQLVVLAVKRNAGSYTYDGIETGGERVAKEIEEALDELAREGYNMKKLSMVGYSLGGLVARYALGLLHSRGWFKKIRPVNFTTFASPHLGVRTPLRGYANHIWNVLGARTLCMSGRQLFMIDKFRDTGRPLLSVLADPDSIFIHALKKFENRSLYANIVNDRSAVFYTTAISRTDPFTQMESLDLNFVKGYETAVLDPDTPFRLRKDQHLPTFYTRLAGGSQTFLKNLPVYVALAVIFPIAFVVFMVNSSIQSVRSRRRIRLHEDEHKIHGFARYRVPFIIQDVQQAVEDAYENVNAAQSQEYLPDGSEEMAAAMESPQESTESLPSSLADHSGTSMTSEKSENATLNDGGKDLPQRSPEFPTLALTPAQFAMIKSLDDCGFQKFPVLISKSNHSHAAIIVRIIKSSFDEGKIVIRHWLNENFKI